MRTRTALAAAIAGSAVAVAGAAPAAAEETAQDTINRLQREGYTVTIDKMGTAPLSKCVVINVRNPNTVTQWVPWVGPGLGDEGRLLVPVITSQSISVTLDCTQR